METVKVGSEVLCEHSGSAGEELGLFPGVVVGLAGGLATVDHGGKRHRTRLNNVKLIVITGVIETSDFFGYNIDMANNPQFGIRFPASYLMKIKKAAEVCEVATGTLIFQAVLEGLPIILKKYGVEMEVTRNSDISHLV